MEKKQKKGTDPNNVRPLTVFYLLPYPLPHAFSLPLLFPYGTAGVYFFLATTAHRKYLLNNKLNQYDR
ncbi:TPA: hypothetical protein MIZ79_03155 [Klebsiella pneumoniae]|nr:hypothetical protein DA795_17965 [Klebsiella pneumoniae]PXJ25962.1 hypothetical protein DMR11_05560 [Klebsiella pneumoniae]HBX5684918.1 hypothetical protein [Klebsiella pneumoniae]HBX5700411.1 hypothetical protein [Klebsiella pneumoniae]HBX7093211.1 hypothetical protein [Klebsiella pneumoniae]